MKDLEPQWRFREEVVIGEQTPSPDIVAAIEQIRQGLKDAASALGERSFHTPIQLTFAAPEEDSAKLVGVTIGDAELSKLNLNYKPDTGDREQWISRKSALLHLMDEVVDLQLKASFSSPVSFWAIDLDGSAATPSLTQLEVPKQQTLDTFTYHTAVEFRNTPRDAADIFTAGIGDYLRTMELVLRDRPKPLLLVLDENTMRVDAALQREGPEGLAKCMTRLDITVEPPAGIKAIEADVFKALDILGISGWTSRIDATSEPTSDFKPWSGRRLPPLRKGVEW